MRLRLLPALLLAAGAIAAAQTPPASRQAPAQSPQADTAKMAVDSELAASLSPQQQRLLDQADQLLDLAQKLKADVDKTNQYTLSLNTLRRAEDIEKLAKTLQKQIQREER
jgi:hypothetical protein